MSIYKQMALQGLSWLVVGLVVGYAIVIASAKRQTREHSALSTGEEDFDGPVGPRVESNFGEPVINRPHRLNRGLRRDTSKHKTRRHRAFTGNKLINGSHWPRASTVDIYGSEFYEDGDPDDNINIENDFVARIRSGNVGFSRLAVPNWFRPLTRSGGSVIVIGKRHFMLDKNANEDYYDSIPGRGVVYGLYVLYENWVDISARHPPTREVQRRQEEYYEVELKATLKCGFKIFEVPSQYEFRFTYGWDIDDSGDTRYGEPYYDCFLLKYTTLKSGKRGFSDETTEVPIRVVQDPRDKSYCGVEMPLGHSPFTGLDRDYNEGSPVFCGYQGKLKFFARSLEHRNQHSCTMELTPIEVIAEEIKQHDQDLYTKLRGERERPSMYASNELKPPRFYRGLYKAKGVQEKDSSTGNYGGSMIMLDEFYFIVHDEVAKQTLDAQYKSGWEWEKIDSPEVPLDWKSDFKSRKEGSDDSWPTFITKLGDTNMSLYKRAKADTAWTLADFKVNSRHDSHRVCDLILSHPSQGGEVVENIAVPIRRVHRSCSQWFCYFMHDDKGDPKMSWRKYAPIMCDKIPEFIAMDTEGRPPGAGKLAMSMDYILELIRISHYDIYKNLIVNPRSSSDPSRIQRADEYRLPPIPATGWFKPLFNNAPQRDDTYLGYAGIATVISKRWFLVADYVANNAFFPTKSEEQLGRLMVSFFHENIWMPDEQRQLPNELPRYTGMRRSVERMNDFPRKEFLIYNHSFSVMSRDMGFEGLGDPPRYRELNSFEIDTLVRETCYALTYLPRDGKLVLSQILLLFNRCNPHHCFFHTNHDLYNSHSDLSKGVHAGVPIFCGDTVVGFNDPHPDQLNRAIFRVLRVSRMMDNANRKADFGEYVTDDPPVWYRNVFSTQLLTSTDENAFLPPMVVLNPKYYFSSELLLNQNLNNGPYNFALFKSREEPTPSTTEGLYDRRNRADDDEIVKAYDYYHSEVYNIGMMKRNPGFEPLNRTVDKLYQKSSFPTKDCYVLYYRYEAIGEKYKMFRFVKTKARITNCDGRNAQTCEITSYCPHIDSAPVVCGGILSYLMVGREIDAKYQPNLHKIVKIPYYIWKLERMGDENPVPNINFVDLVEE